VPHDLERRTVLCVAGLATAIAVSPNGYVGTAELHEACADALKSVIAVYETTDLATTTVTLSSLEQTTHQVPRHRRLRGTAAIEWMRLHAAVLTAGASAAYDQGRHAEAARRADRAATLARAAGDGALAARALSLHARVVRPHSPAVALQIAGTAARIAGHSPARALLAGKVAASAYAASGDRAGVRDAVHRAWRTMDTLDPAAQGRPGFSLETYSPADLALASAEALTTVGAADEATPYLERARDLISESGQTGMVVSVRIAQARAELTLPRPDRDKAALYVSDAVSISAERPAEWVARLVRDISELANQRTGHPLEDLVDSTAGWV
jgi:hypothetical protein